MQGERGCTRWRTVASTVLPGGSDRRRLCGHALARHGRDRALCHAGHPIAAARSLWRTLRTPRGRAWGTCGPLPVGRCRWSAVNRAVLRMPRLL
jgi:hypothetical protein